jgi:Orsellinic acid/F9775 biosynthesis cluster protein D
MIDERMDVDINEQSKIPLSVDSVYNLIVCKDCGLSLPSEWVLSHLKKHHGIQTTSEQIALFLGLNNEVMSIADVKELRRSIWVGKAVQNIPIVTGIKCNICQYSVKEKNAMKNHFTDKHKDVDRVENTEQCQVQRLFSGGLQKYIQVEQDENVNMEEGETMDWKKAVEQDFYDSIANIKSVQTNERGNLRLMNVFIAKTRWDVMMEGLEFKDVVKLTGLPTIDDELHRIILCGRRYIHKTCKELDKGSIIVKRLLMSTRSKLF